MADRCVSPQTEQLPPGRIGRESLIRSEQVTTVAQLSTSIATVSLAGALILVDTFWSSVSHTRLLVFLAALSTLHGIAVFSSKRWLMRGRQNASSLALGARIVFAVTIALLWAVMLTSLMVAAGADQRQMLFYVLSGLMSASVLLAALPVAAMSLAVIAAASLLVAISLVGSRIAIQHALLVLLFLTANVTVVLIQYRAFARRVANDLIRDEQHDIIGMLLKNFEESASDWLWEVDAAFRLTRVSERLATVLSSSREALHGRDLRTMLLDADPGDEGGEDDGDRLIRALRSREPFRDVEVRVQCEHTTRWISLTGQPIVNRQAEFQGFRGVGSDVTAARRSNERIAHLARYDALTELPNRTFFQEALDRACGSGRPFGLMCLDLDDFKKVNDTLGHAKGDTLLMAVAERLRGCLLETDIVARLGGDEFAVLRFGVDADAAVALAGRLIACVGEPYRIAAVPTRIGLSIGIALSDGVADNAAGLLQGADLALYQCKHGARGGWTLFETSMAERALARRALEADLGLALDRRELLLEFQPIWDIASGGLIAAEALVRWQHPERGRISPAEFIPIAEKTGLIVPLGRWVLREACRQAAGWAGDARVSVNLSSLQFRDPDLLAMIDDALAATGLPASRLELEITESVFLDAADQTIACLRSLRARGINIALDDFGTGYSSLSYLRSFPFDKVKIDQSFIRDLCVDSDAIAIVQAIVGMASSLGMRTTAEGVENAEQARMLRDTGCTQVQGYMFGRPCGEDRIAGLMRDNDRTTQPSNRPETQAAE